jgi:hypothetical protein
MTNPPLTREQREELKRLCESYKRHLREWMPRDEDDDALTYAERKLASAVPRLLAAVDALEGERERLMSQLREAATLLEDSAAPFDAACVIIRTALETTP